MILLGLEIVSGNESAVTPMITSPPKRAQPSPTKPYGMHNTAPYGLYTFLTRSMNDT